MNARVLMTSFLLDGATRESAWLIERKDSSVKEWVPTAVFPLSLSYSTILFYLQEVARLQANNDHYEGIRLSTIIGERCILIEAYIVFGRPQKGKRRGE